MAAIPMTTKPESQDSGASALLPCPNGHAAAAVQMCKYGLDDTYPSGWCYVICRHALATEKSCGWHCGGYPTAAEAIAAWNTRASAGDQAVAFVDEGEEGLFVELIPDRAVKCGDFLYTRAQDAARAVSDLALFEMKSRAQRAHQVCNDLRLAYPEITELGDDGVLHEEIHDILRVDTPTAQDAAAILNLVKRAAFFGWQHSTWDWRNVEGGCEEAAPEFTFREIPIIPTKPEQDAAGKGVDAEYARQVGLYPLTHAHLNPAPIPAKPAQVGQKLQDIRDHLINAVGKTDPRLCDWPGETAYEQSHFAAAFELTAVVPAQDGASANASGSGVWVDTITVCSRNEPDGPPWCAVAKWDAKRRCYVTIDPMYGHPAKPAQVGQKYREPTEEDADRLLNRFTYIARTSPNPHHMDLLAAMKAIGAAVPAQDGVG